MFGAMNTNQYIFSGKPHFGIFFGTFCRYYSKRSQGKSAQNMQSKAPQTKALQSKQAKICSQKRPSH